MNKNDNGESGAPNPEVNPVNDPMASLIAAFADAEDAPANPPVGPSEPAEPHGGAPAIPEGGGETEGSGEGEEGEGGGQNADEGEERLREESGKNKFEESAYGLQKRIGKLTAQKKAAYEEVEALKSQLAELQKKVAGRGAGAGARPDPIEGANSEEELEKYAQFSRAERDAAIRLLSSQEDEFELGGKVYTRAQIVDYLESVNDALEYKIPARKAKLAAKSALESKRARMAEEARKSFDWAADENSVGSQWVKAQLADPDLEANLPMLLGYAFEGLGVTKIRKNFATQKAKRRPADSPATPPPSAPKGAQPSFRRPDGSFDKELALTNLWKD